jgi:hypothetical protein
MPGGGRPPNGSLLRNIPGLVGLISFTGHPPLCRGGARASGDALTVNIYKGRFTLWPSKSRGRAIEWPNFVESPKK